MGRAGWVNTAVTGLNLGGWSGDGAMKRGQGKW